MPLLYFAMFRVDKDYPGNKLTGAEFEVYRDSNGNQELDEEDELLGLMEETSTGIYEMTHVEYGGAFVKESKAPDSFLLDPLRDAACANFVH